MYLVTIIIYSRSYFIKIVITYNSSDIIGKHCTMIYTSYNDNNVKFTNK